MSLATIHATAMANVFGLYVVETDLDKTTISGIEDKNKDRLEWYAEYNKAEQGKYLAVLYKDADGVYLFPKQPVDREVPISTDPSGYVEKLARPHLTLIMDHGDLIDVSSDYTDYVVYDTSQPESPEGLGLYLRSSVDAASSGRTEIERAVNHAKLRLQYNVCLNQDRQPVYPKDILIKRDRGRDCLYPKQYESGDGDFVQDRQMATLPLVLPGYADGQAYCWSNIEGPLINGYTARKTGFCHTTVSKPVGYSFKADNGCVCDLVYYIWEHHGCRGTPKDFSVGGLNHYATINIHVYSWTVFINPCV